MSKLSDSLAREVSLQEWYGENRSYAEIAKQQSLPHAYDQVLDFSVGGMGDGQILDPSLTPSGDGTYYADGVYQASNAPGNGPEKAEEIEIAQARVVKATAKGTADIQWTIAVANSHKLNQQSHATAQKEFESAQALAERNQLVALQPLASAKEQAKAVADTVYWTSYLVAQNIAKLAETTLSNTWQTAMLVNKATVLGQVAQTMQLPWTTFQAEKAAVEAAWWQASGAPLQMQQAIAENAADQVFRTAENPLHLAWVQGENVAENQYQVALAESDYQQAMDDALADETFEFTRATAEAAYQLSHGQARSTDVTNRYSQQRDYVVSSTSITSVLVEDDGNYESLSQVTAAEGVYRSAFETADQTYAIALANHEVTRVGQQNGAEQGYTLAMQGVNLAYKQSQSAVRLAHQVAYLTILQQTRVSLDQTLESYLSQYSQSHPSPWATYEASVAQANTALEVAGGAAYLAQKIAELTADRNLDLATTIAEQENTLTLNGITGTERAAQAAAEAVHVAGVNPNLHATRVAEAEGEGEPTVGVIAAPANPATPGTPGNSSTRGGGNKTPATAHPLLRGDANPVIAPFHFVCSDFARDDYQRDCCALCQSGTRQVCAEGRCHLVELSPP